MDVPFCIPDSFTSIGNLFVIAFCVNEWMLYIGGAFALLDSTSTTMFRSLISKNVHANEIGKVFSVVGVLFALLPFASGPIFGFLYKSTVSYQPNAFLFLVIGIKVVLFIVVYVINIGMRKEDKRYEKKLQAQDLTSKEEQLPLQTKLISENRDNLVSHNVAAKTLANKVTDDESCSGGTN